MAAPAMYPVLFLLLFFGNIFSIREADFPNQNKTKIGHLKRDVLIGISYILMVATMILISCFCFLHLRIRRTRFIKKKVMRRNVFRSLFTQSYPDRIRKWYVRWFRGRNTRDTAVIHLLHSEYLTRINSSTPTPLMSTSSNQHSILMLQNSPMQPTEIPYNYRSHLINTPSGPTERSCYILPLENILQCPSSYAINQSRRFPDQAGQAEEEVRDYKITIYCSPNDDPLVNLNRHYKTA